MTGLLHGYRLIEIGDESAMFAGKLLGDMGCDVLRVERPTGDPFRTRPPLVPWGDDELSATWLAYNTSKRSVALDIETDAGRRILEDLVDGADMVIVSGSAEWVASNGLDPSSLRARRPRLVATAITPFGMEGPYRDYAATDLTLQAAGGMLFLNGDEDRPPVRISEEMAWPQAGSQAAFATMAALFNAQVTGAGDGIDFSVHEAIVSALVSVDEWWQLEEHIPARSARVRLGRDAKIRMIWPCKDGFVTYRLSFGQGLGNRNLHLVNWMAEEGMDDGLLEVPWEYVSTLELTQEEVDSFQSRIERFFMTKTKAELYAGALERRMMLFPVNELTEMLDDRQLQARDFFCSKADPNDNTVLFPGAFFQAGPDLSPAPGPIPSLGEHTFEVLSSLPGYDAERIEGLSDEGVVLCR